MPYADPEYHPELISEEAADHPFLRAQKWRPGQRRPDFYDYTLDQLIADSKAQGRIKAGMDPDGSPSLFFKDVTTGRWCSTDAVQIGHIEPWEKFLKRVGPSNREEATWAYNDHRNLRLESSITNQSHEFEQGRDSEDENDYDLADPFIDSSATFSAASAASAAPAAAASSAYPASSASAAASSRSASAATSADEAAEAGGDAGSLMAFAEVAAELAPILL